MPKLELDYSNADGSEKFTMSLDIGAFGNHDLHAANIAVPGVAAWSEPDKQSLLRTFGQGIFNKARDMKAVADAPSTSAPSSPPAAS